MAAGWMVRRHAGVSRFEVQFPELSVGVDLPRYVRVSAGGATELLRTATRRGAAGDQVWVSSQSGLPDGAIPAVQPAKVWEYQAFRSWAYMPLRLALIGAGVGIVGLWIEAAITLGQYIVLVPTSESTLTVLRAISFALKLIAILIPTAIAVLKEPA